MKYTFEQWLSAVDVYCRKLIGMNHDDLSDVCYSDMWQAGVSPLSAARKAIKQTMGS